MVWSLLVHSYNDKAGSSVCARRLVRVQRQEWRDGEWADGESGSRGPRAVTFFMVRQENFTWWCVSAFILSRDTLMINGLVSAGRDCVVVFLLK